MLASASTGTGDGTHPGQADQATGDAAAAPRPPGGPPALPSPAPGSLSWWLDRHTARLAAEAADPAGGTNPADPTDPTDPADDGDAAVTGDPAGGQVRADTGQPNGEGVRHAGRQPVDLDRLADAALRIVDADGMAALTMRRLAEDVGVGMAAIYRVVPSRQALLTEVLDRVLGRAAEPQPGQTARRALEQWARNVRAALFAHPAVAALLPADQLAGPCAMRLREAALAVLLGAGMAPGEAAILYWAVVQFTIGATVIDLAAAASDGNAIERADIYAHLPRDRYPSVVAAADASRSQSGKAFDLGLSAMLAGAALSFPALDRVP